MARINLLDTRTISFGDLISNGKIYKVPDFQRDYSWKEEISEFTDIIMNNKAVINGNSNQALEVMKMVTNIYDNDGEWKKKFK